MTFRNALKYTLVILATYSMTGCYLVLEVPEGGGVQSVSGVRDCAVNSACQFEVTDTNLEETFIAVPNSGYRFVKWQAGEDHLCGDSANPVCITSNTGWEGNATAEAVIASEKVYYLKPVFETIGAPKYVVRDGNGDEIGDVLSVTHSGASVRLTHDDGQGTEHGYQLDFSGGAVSPANVQGRFWDDPSCTGFETHVAFDELSFNMEPLFSMSYTFTANLELGQYNLQYNLVRVAPVDQAVFTQLYRLQIHPSGVPECTLLNVGRYYVPVTVEHQDITSQFMPPFTLHME